VANALTEGVKERDWERWTRRLWGLRLETYPLRVTLRQGNEDLPVLVPVLLPHETYHAMHCKSEQLFLQSVVGDEGPGSILEFWEHALTERWAAQHPAFEDPSRLDRTVPVRFWYDGVEAFSDVESHYFAFVSALSNGADPMLENLMFASLNEPTVPTHRLKKAAFREIVRAFGWSIRQGRRGPRRRDSAEQSPEPQRPERAPEPGAPEPGAPEPQSPGETRRA